MCKVGKALPFLLGSSWKEMHTESRFGRSMALLISLVKLPEDFFKGGRGIMDFASESLDDSRIESLIPVFGFYDSRGYLEFTKESRANERPLMLEKGNYIPRKSRCRRFLYNKLKEAERMWNSIHNGPYVRPMIPDPDGDVNINDTVKQILELLSKMTKRNKKQYIADVKVMNYLLQEIPNDIYNSVDACKNAKEIWERIKRLMFGSDVTSHVRHSSLINKVDKFAVKEGESLKSMYERLTTLVSIMDCKNVHPISVSINTKFLNGLQPEWSKYVTMVRHNQTGETVSYDILYDSLVQFKPHVISSKEKNAAKNHDPLALTAHSNTSSSQSHDKLTAAMMLLARAIIQKFSTHTNNRLRTSSNTRNQAVIQDGGVDIQTKNAGYGGNGNKNAGRQSKNLAFNAGNRNDDSNQIIQRKPRVRDAKYFREQMLLAMKEEAKSNLNNEENDFMLDTSYGEETMEELTDVVMLMARIQPANGNAETVPSYDAKAVSEVNASSKVHEQMRHEKRKIIIQTSDDDQIDSNIILDDPYVENNSGTSDHDSNDHDEYHKIQMLAYDV
uniref:Uncharacterized protein n=1 Tax=Tanacetum cinerariifolium TaxID=118510 RepID=A0A6L2JWY2_TANCI|nr:hypothetical protein [Tanacetum cinerariifolium]